jgi:hypothetical protein
MSYPSRTSTGFRKTWPKRVDRVSGTHTLRDAPPIRRFELAKPTSLEVIDGDIAIDQEPSPVQRTVSRRVDRAGRISILKHRYHVGRHLAGEAVTIESREGRLHVTHNGVVVATHVQRHLIDDDDKMDRRSKAAKPAPPTKGGEVLRGVDRSGSVSFAGTMDRAGNRFIGQTAGVRLVGDTVQITIDGALIRTHRARHDKTKEFGALAQPNGKPRRSREVSHSYRSHSGTRVVNLHRSGLFRSSPPLWRFQHLDGRPHGLPGSRNLRVVRQRGEAL